MEVQLNSLHLNIGISNNSGWGKILDVTLRSGGELLGLTHMEFQVIPIKSQGPINVWWKVTL
jgi:hypothetical protein